MDNKNILQAAIATMLKEVKKTSDIYNVSLSTGSNYIFSPGYITQDKEDVVTMRFDGKEGNHYKFTIVDSTNHKNNINKTITLTGKQLAHAMNKFGVEKSEIKEEQKQPLFFKVGDTVELINGTKAKVFAIPDKYNPKYGKTIIVTTDKNKNISVDINKDIKKTVKEDEAPTKLSQFSLGMKTARVVISGEDVAKNYDKILKLGQDIDPNFDAKYFEKTGKIVGSMSKVKIQPLNLKFRDRSLKAVAEDKPQTKK